MIVFQYNETTLVSMKPLTFLMIFAVLALGYTGNAFAETVHGESNIVTKAAQESSMDLSDEEWKQKLTDEQFQIMRKQKTELPHSSPLNSEKREGVYKCGACGATLFASDNKFDSGTGWPSFDRPANGMELGTSTDRKLGMERTEVHCPVCGAHLGHVFNDGSQHTTGERYCINGTALEFVPNENAVPEE